MMEVSFPSSMKQTHCCFQLLNYSYRTDRVGHASYTPKHRCTAKLRSLSSLIMATSESPKGDLSDSSPYASTLSYFPESANILWDTDAVKLAGFKGVTIGVCAMNSKVTTS